VKKAKMVKLLHPVHPVILGIQVQILFTYSGLPVVLRSIPLPPKTLLFLNPPSNFCGCDGNLFSFLPKKLKETKLRVKS